MDDSSFSDLDISNGKRNSNKKGTAAKKKTNTDELLADISMEEANDISRHLEKSLLQNSLNGMSQAEIAQHHELCMRLAAENKINLKNAFGLHLIAIMKKMVKDSPDLQLASLSLAASSKIYAGRVEALYKDTYKFHSNLQCMIGKKGTRGNNDLEGPDDDPSEKGASKSNQNKSKCKSHLTTDENLSATQGNLVTKAHGNFICINSAFSASRQAEKLLAFTFQNDNNKICHLLRTVKVFSMKSLTPHQNFILPKKCKGFLEKVSYLNPDELESEIEGVLGSPILHENEAAFSPRADNMECLFNDSLAINNVSPIREEEEQDSLDGIIDRFSVLDITADAFAHDISRVVTGADTVDMANLPPNSVLKKVLKDKSRFTKIVKKPEEKVPFFKGEVQIDKSLFTKDKKKHRLTDVGLSEWALSGTSIFFSNSEFHFSLTSDINSEKDISQEMLTYTFATNSESDMLLKQYFLRRTKPWQKQNPKTSAVKIRPSSLFLRNDINRETGDGFSVEQDLVQCLRRLSFSPPPDDGDCLDNSISSPGCDAVSDAQPDFDPQPDFASPNDMRVNSSLEQSVLENIELVSPPELVKKISVRFDKNLQTVNTEKAKSSLWSILHNHLNEKKDDSVLLSDVHKELQNELSTPSQPPNTESITLQFTFVMLLILANEKVLMLENIGENNDIVIKKDIPEIGSSEGF